ncbi:MAG: membrane-bound ClpP family serine protease [Planctomycetota bacterium]|jgi:membrane-bound ClpP family serine protease
MTLIIVMFMIATLLVIAEVMFPSFGLLGLLAAGSFLVAILESFAMGDQQGYIAVGTAVVLIPTAIIGGFYVLNHTPLGNRLILKGPEHNLVKGQGTDKRLASFVGKVGVAITPLAPGGTVEIEDTTFSAVSMGEFIDRNSQVKVIQVEGNRVVVETDNEAVT